MATRKSRKRTLVDMQEENGDTLPTSSTKRMKLNLKMIQNASPIQNNIEEIQQTEESYESEQEDSEEDDSDYEDRNDDNAQTKNRHHERPKSYTQQVAVPIASQSRPKTQRLTHRRRRGQREPSTTHVSGTSSSLEPRSINKEQPLTSRRRQDQRSTTQTSDAPSLVQPP
eukprot:800564_1